MWRTHPPMGSARSRVRRFRLFSFQAARSSSATRRPRPADSSRREYRWHWHPITTPARRLSKAGRRPSRWGSRCAALLRTRRSSRPRSTRRTRLVGAGGSEPFFTAGAPTSWSSTPTTSASSRIAWARRSWPRSTPREGASPSPARLAAVADPRIERLRSVPLFGGCTDKELQFISSHADEVDFASGRTLCKKGETGGDFFVILEGSARVEAGDGERGLRPGGVFGEIAVLGNRTPAAPRVGGGPAGRVRAAGANVPRGARSSS